MTTPMKKRKIQRSIIKNCRYQNDINKTNNEENENKIVKKEGMEIQVDFEGYNPQDSDFYGIKTLLQQLFLKAHVDLSNLTNLIISQNYIGSVVKQSNNFEESDNEDDVNDIFGITTAISLFDRKTVPCIQQLRKILKQLTNEYAAPSTNIMIKNILENDSTLLGLLINERFINIPVQISVPLLKNLISEIQRAVNKKLPFNFTYYILICKIYKANGYKKKNKNKEIIVKESNIIWSNPEEEIFDEEATCSFEFSVEKESSNGLSGNWTEDDNEMVPYRRVLLLESSKLQKIIKKIKDLIL